MHGFLAPVLVACALFFASLGCERVREPPSSMNEPSATTRAETVTPALAFTLLASASSVERLEADRCIEPLRSPPPKKAEKASSCPSGPKKSRPSLARGKVLFPSAAAAVALDVEIARTPSEHERGLMYRTSLAKERGMIFAWDGERTREFWMKNTCIPLDMLFIAKDGTVVGVLEQVPVLNEEPRSVRCAAAYVLEVNAGWSREHGVMPGMKASLNL